jgi:hypothetical protein
MPSLSLIESKTLTSTAAVVTFSNIPQTYDDLILYQNSRLTFDSHFFKIWFNGDGTSTPPTSTEYHSVYLWSWDTGSYCYFSTSNNNFWSLGNTYGSYGANTFNFGKFYLYNYSNSTLKKSAWNDSGEVNTTNAPPYGIHGGWWDSTSTVTSLSISPNAVTPGTNGYAAGSSFRLYGIKG